MADRIITENQASNLIKYLSTRPYQEVHAIIADVYSLPPVPVAKPCDCVKSTKLAKAEPTQVQETYDKPSDIIT